MIKKFFLQAIRLYQKTLSPDHGVLRGITAMRCRYYPSCSEYGFRAIDAHGVVRGSIKTIARIARCGPWSAGGHDPVADN